MKSFFRISMVVVLASLAMSCTSPSATVAPATPAAVAPSPSTPTPREPASDVQIGSTSCSYEKNKKTIRGRCPVVSCFLTETQTSTKIIYPDKETLCGKPTEFTFKRSCKFQDYYIPYGHSVMTYEKMVVAAGEGCRAQARTCDEGGAMTAGFEYLTCRVADDPTDSSTVE